MPQFSLYPYNYWILYAAIVLLILTVISSAVKAMKQLKSAMEIKSTLDKIEISSKKMSIKQEVIAEKAYENATRNKLMLAAIPVFLTLRNLTRLTAASYRKVRGFYRSVSDAYRKASRLEDPDKVARRERAERQAEIRAERLAEQRAEKQEKGEKKEQRREKREEVPADAQLNAATE